MSTKKSGTELRKVGLTRRQAYQEMCKMFIECPLCHEKIRVYSRDPAEKTAKGHLSTIHGV